MTSRCNAKYILDFAIFFDRKPEKGIDHMLSHQVLEENPEVVAKFLLSEPGISKQKLGEYLGNLQNDFNMEVLRWGNCHTIMYYIVAIRHLIYTLF